MKLLGELLYNHSDHAHNRKYAANKSKESYKYFINFV